MYINKTNQKGTIVKQRKKKQHPCDILIVTKKQWRLKRSVLSQKE